MVSLAPPSADVPTPLPGPDWLVDQRARAAAVADSAELPSWESEEWRYSPIDTLDLSAYSPVAAAPVDADVLADLVATLPPHGTVVVLRDGHVVHADGPWLVGLDEAGSIVADASFEAGDVFDELNAAHTVDPVVVDIPAGTDVEAPIVVLHEITHDGAAVFPRLIVRVGANASVNVVDIVRSGDIRALFVPVTEFRVADAARAGYASVQELGPRVWQVGSQTSEVGAQATYSSGCIAFGGDYARTRVSCRLVGRGSTGNLGAAYFGDGDQVLDFRTFQDHLAADTTSNLLFKGVLDDASRSIYSGLIRVSEDARGTNAFQTNRNIKLSDKAWAESVPNLEIETNDVRCSHASTVGPIDEEQRFYLESRGVPTAEAERLIIAGFFEEVLDALPVSSLADGLRARIAEKLDDNAGEDAQ